MKTKYLIILSLLCSLMFVFSSCSQYDDMGDGNTTGGGGLGVNSENSNDGMPKSGSSSVSIN